MVKSIRNLMIAGSLSLFLASCATLPPPQYTSSAENFSFRNVYVTSDTVDAQQLGAALNESLMLSVARTKYDPSYPDALLAVQIVPTQTWKAFFGLPTNMLVLVDAVNPLTGEILQRTRLVVPDDPDESSYFSEVIASFIRNEYQLAAPIQPVAVRRIKPRRHEISTKLYYDRKKGEDPIDYAKPNQDAILNENTIFGSAADAKKKSHGIAPYLKLGKSDSVPEPLQNPNSSHVPAKSDLENGASTKIAIPETSSSMNSEQKNSPNKEACVVTPQNDCKKTGH